MSVTLNLYRMSKKDNSSGTPAGLSVNPIATVTGEFREPWDILEPVITVEDVSAGGSSVFTRSYPVNYAQIYTGAADRNRLYWITRIVWISDKLLELHLTEDALGTWSAEIRSSTQYVLRTSDTSLINPYIPDDLRPMTAEQHRVVSDISANVPWWGIEPVNGYYIIGVLSYGFSAWGSTCYYRLNADAFEDFREQMMSSTNWTGMQFTEIEQDLYKSLFDPFQYITTCMWFPICPDANVGGGISTIPLGWWPLSLTGSNLAYPLAHATYGDNISLLADMGNHPQYAAQSSYLQAAPYRQACLYILPFGSIPIDTAMFANSATAQYIDAQYRIDYVTGLCQLRLTKHEDGTIIAEQTAQMGVTIRVAQATQDFISGVSSARDAVRGAVKSVGGIAGSIAGFAGGNAALGLAGIGSAANGIVDTAVGVGSAVQAFAPSIASSGSDGSFLYTGMRAYCITVSQYVMNIDRSDYGAPAGVITALSGITAGSYCRMGNPHVTWGGCTAAERAVIETTMAAGIILEA